MNKQSELNQKLFDLGFFLRSNISTQHLTKNQSILCRIPSG